MIFIVDGTGPSDDQEYKKAMAKSFCSQLHAETVHKSIYVRGPTLDGSETHGIASDIATMIAAVPSSHPIFLCGYSRGGAAVISAAWSVRPRAIQAMFLFDAVDRAFGTMAETIPENTKIAYHARRDPRFSQKYDSAVLFTARDSVFAGLKAVASLTPVGPLVGAPLQSSIPELAGTVRSFTVAASRAETLKWRSRNDAVPGLSMFGNCGTQPPARVHMRRFPGTHGALGGVPWSDDEVPGDAAVVPRIRDWMWRHFRHEKLFAHSV